MSKNNSQSGFGVVEVILIIVILGIIGFTGWRVYEANREVSQAPVDNSTVEKKADQAKKTEYKVYDAESIAVSFSYPAEWTVYATYPNGVTLQSPDFSAEAGFRKIKSGSIVTITKQTTVSLPDRKESLEKLALLTANDHPNTKSFTTLAGLQAIKITHSNGENRNNHVAVLTDENNQSYQIDQQYMLDSENPYPELIDKIVSSFKINE